MKLNLEMEIDDSMSVDSLRRKVRCLIQLVNREKTIIDHHYIIEKNGKKYEHVRAKKKVV